MLLLLLVFALAVGATPPTSSPTAFYQDTKIVGDIDSGNFGQALVLSNDSNTMVVGAPGDPPGVFYILTRLQNDWSIGSPIAPSGNAGPQSRIGSSVAISRDGNTVAIGGYQDNSGIGATWIFVWNGTSWSQQGSKLIGTGAIGSSRQSTGLALSADGNTLASSGERDNSNIGATWIWTRSGGTWTQQAKLVGTNVTGGISFQGSIGAVSLSDDGDTLAVGGYFDDSQKGAVWVWTRSGSTWTQEAKIVPTSGVVGTARVGFSTSLSVDGNTLAVGGNQDNSSEGAVWIFTRSGGVWTQQGSKLVGTGGTSDAQQGYSVSLTSDGNQLLVGGPENNFEGAVWQFMRVGSTWSQIGSLIVGPGGAVANQQGISVSVSGSGDTIAWGSPSNDERDMGALWIRMFSTYTLAPGTLSTSAPSSTPTRSPVVPTTLSPTTLSPTTLSPTTGSPTTFSPTTLSPTSLSPTSLSPTTLSPTTLSPTTPTASPTFFYVESKINGTVSVGEFGQRVALSNDSSTLIVGAPGESPGGFYVLTRTLNTWSAPARQAITGNSGFPKTGYTVAISRDGLTAAIGGPQDTSNAGAVWVFIKSGVTWLQQAKLVGTGGIGPAYQGSAVAISADGNTLAIGGQTFNTWQGSAWVWTRSGSTWTQQVRLAPLGYIGTELYLGSANTASISDDGNTLAVGGYRDNSGIGAVWIWTRIGTLWTLDQKIVPSDPIGQSQFSSTSLSADGNTLAVGGYGDNSGAGAVWIYVRSGGVFTQQGGKLIGTGGSSNAQQGYAVALTPDGNKLMVGAPGNGVGAVWRFVRIGTTWSQFDSVIVGSGGIGSNQQGITVATSATGDRLVWGSQTDDSSKGAIWLLYYPIVTFTPTTSYPSQAPSLSPTILPPETFDLSVSTRKGAYEDINFTYTKNGEPINLASTLPDLSFRFLEVEGNYSVLVHCSDLSPIEVNETIPAGPIPNDTWVTGLVCVNYTNITDYFSFGEDLYPYFLAWTGNESLVSFLDIEVLSPLQVEPTILYGTEGEALEVNFTVTDTLGTYTGEFVLIFDAVPSNGMFNLSDGSAVEIYVPYYLNESYVYVPRLYYFNTINNGFANFYGEGVNGCPLNVSLGCPDIATVSVLVEDQLTEPSNSSILVNGVFTMLSNVTYPPGPLELFVSAGYFFQGSFYVTDMDDQAYMIGFKAYGSLTNVLFLVNETELAEATQRGEFFKVDCDTLSVGCDNVAFYGRPRFMNYLFYRMGLFYYGSSTTSTLYIALYKPAPDGVTALNSYEVFQNGNPDFEKTYSLDIITGGTKSPTVKSVDTWADDLLSGLKIALYTIFAIGGVCILGCLVAFCYFFNSIVSYVKSFCSACACCFRTCSKCWSRCSCLLRCPCCRLFNRCRPKKPVKLSKRQKRLEEVRMVLGEELRQVVKTHN